MKQWMDTFDALLTKPIVKLLVVFAMLMVGFFNALPHMHEAIWQDEAATLFFHASRGIVAPFLHYMSPNNHIAFSSMLAAWMKLFPGGLDVFTLRLLPTLLFLAAIPITFFAALRLGGPLCALLATLAFSLSAVTANFATQLRGYGPSWLFLSMLLLTGLHIFANKRSLRWKIGYSLCCFVAVALLPTNVFFACAMAFSLAIYHLGSGVKADRSNAAGYVLLLVAPAASLVLAYGLVWKELMSFKDVGFSTWQLSGLASEWLSGTWASFGWLLLFVGGGLAVGIKELGRSIGAKKLLAPPEFVFAVLLIITFGIAVAAIPQVPFPRTLVPFLPIWLITLASIMSFGVRALATKGAFVTFGVGALLFLAPAWAAPSISDCRNFRPSTDAFEYGLCHQYFRARYFPVRVLNAWAELTPTGLPIVSDFEGYFALQALRSGAQIYEYRNFQLSGHLPPLIVANGREQLKKICNHLGLDPSSYALVADTGYFKLYGPAKAP